MRCGTSLFMWTCIVDPRIRLVVRDELARVFVNRCTPADASRPATRTPGLTGSGTGVPPNARRCTRLVKKPTGDLALPLGSTTALRVYGPFRVGTGVLPLWSRFHVGTPSWVFPDLPGFDTDIHVRQPVWLRVSRRFFFPASVRMSPSDP